MQPQLAIDLQSFYYNQHHIVILLLTFLWHSEHGGSWPHLWVWTSLWKPLGPPDPEWERYSHTRSTGTEEKQKNTTATFFYPFPNKRITHLIWIHKVVHTVTGAGVYSPQGTATGRCKCVPKWCSVASNTRNWRFLSTPISVQHINIRSVPHDKQHSDHRNWIEQLPV